MSQSQPVAELLKTAFGEEIAARGGTIADVFEAPPRVILRGVLPEWRDIVPGDSVQAGIALRADEHDVWVHPYVFRQVCKNGAIMARSAESTRIALCDWSHEATEADVREAVRLCASKEAFTQAASLMRTARTTPADVALTLLPLLSSWSGRAGSAFINQIMNRFFDDGDRSNYGLMNAVTSVARDTKDPEHKWRLEELGGSVPALVRPIVPRQSAPRRLREPALV